MDDYALVLNAGSSSLKFCVYERPEKQDWRLESRGQIEGIGAAPSISARDAGGRVLIDKEPGRRCSRWHQSTGNLGDVAPVNVR
jgi:acetate kinase